MFPFLIFYFSNLFLLPTGNLPRPGFVFVPWLERGGCTPAHRKLSRLYGAYFPGTPLANTYFLCNECRKCLSKLQSLPNSVLVISRDQPPPGMAAIWFQSSTTAVQGTCTLTDAVRFTLFLEIPYGFSSFSSDCPCIA